MLKLFKKLQLIEWIMALISVGFIVFQVWLDIEMIDYTKQITMLAQTEGAAISEIWLNGGKMLLCAFGSLVGAVATGFLVSMVAAGLARRLRHEVFEKVIDFSLTEINQFTTSSLITRTINDVNQVQMFLTMGVTIMIKSPITAIWVITKITATGPAWTLATGIAVGLLLVLILTLMSLVIPKFKKIQILTDNLTKATRENLSGIRVIRAYNAEGYQDRKFDTANEDFTKANLFINRSFSLLQPSIMIIINVLNLSIFLIGAYLINDASILEKLDVFGNMMVFSQYAIQAIMSFMMMVMIFVLLPRASVSSKRINQVLETKNVIKNGNFDMDSSTKGIELSFENVSFKYEDAESDVLSNISFKVKAGQTVAFIGSTGSGKSTLLNLIPRFYDVTNGSLKINQADIREYNLPTLNNLIGYIPQRAVILQGTIRSNVIFGDNGNGQYSDEDINQAIEIAQAKEFVSQLEKGLDSPTSQGGSNLSGGQKQRLAIARALCRKPRILLFDDSFSALDYKTDRLLRSALKEKTKGVTKVIVAQRIGTILDADNIIVLDEGKIVGMGTHQELLSNCSVYQEIAQSQLSQEEIEGTHE